MTLSNRISNTANEFLLDTAYPYDYSPGSPSDSDQPSLALGGFVTEAGIDWQFEDWLMWTPPGAGSTPAPIQFWKWNVHADVVWNSATSTYDLVGPTPLHFTQIAGVDINVYPQWTNILTL